MPTILCVAIHLFYKHRSSSCHVPGILLKTNDTRRVDLCHPFLTVVMDYFRPTNHFTDSTKGNEGTRHGGPPKEEWPPLMNKSGKNFPCRGGIFGGGQVCQVDKGRKNTLGRGISTRKGTEEDLVHPFSGRKWKSKASRDRKSGPVMGRQETTCPSAPSATKVDGLVFIPCVSTVDI